MLPQDFVERMQFQLGHSETNSLLQAIEQTPSPVSIRLNLQKKAMDLPAQENGRVPWCSSGVYLQERPLFTRDPLFHAGCYYVQEASSMFIEQAYRKILEDIQPKRVLDLCAAPGGKSTLWRSLMPEGTLLVANEPLRQRSQILVENLTKWGHPDVAVTQAFPEDYAKLGSFFDVIATDVPCSGEGMFRKDSTAIEEWSLHTVESCALRQWNIIENVWPALREGGYMVYSTCTYNQSEDEDMVARICNDLGAEIVSLHPSPDWNIIGDTTNRNLPVYHFFPHRTKGEGFFLALLRKTSAAPLSYKKKSRKGFKQQANKFSSDENTVHNWLKSKKDFKIVSLVPSCYYAVRESLLEEIEYLSQNVHTLMAGLFLAEKKGKKLVPQQALALSNELSPFAFPKIEITLEQALSYLHRESMVLPSDVSTGYVILTYHQIQLGFVHNLGRRANNLYPQEWRIRSFL